MHFEDSEKEFTNQTTNIIILTEYLNVQIMYIF